MTTVYCNNHFNIILPSRLSLPSGLSPSGLPSKPIRHLSSPPTPSCPVHLFRLHFTTCITITMFGEQYQSCSCSLCYLIASNCFLRLNSRYFLQHPVLEHTHPIFSHCDKPNITPAHNNRHSCGLHVLISIF